MRVTSTSINVKSLAARAASLTLCDPVRVEPGMTSILGIGIGGSAPMSGLPDIGIQKIARRSCLPKQGVQ
jgi:hypothetical protein